MTTRLVVLASGNGSNLQAVLDACAAGIIDGEVVAVVSNNAGAGALDRARSSCVDGLLVARQGTGTRSEYDTELAQTVVAYRPDLVVLAGWMLLLSSAFLDAVGCPVVNLHPALPGELPGTRAIERAHDEARRGLRTRSGVMVHLVPDEGVDCGPVLGTTEVPVDDQTSLEEFTRAMHEAEHYLLTSVLTGLCTDKRKG